jgi:Uncharacterized protein conserved in bacteria (DUF2188)
MTPSCAPTWITSWSSHVPTAGGPVNATAPSELHRSTTPKPTAEAAARAQAKRWRAELVIKGANGQILRRDSYGGDPARRPG